MTKDTIQYNEVVEQNKSLQAELNLTKKMIELLAIDLEKDFNVNIEDYRKAALQSVNTMGEFYSLQNKDEVENKMFEYGGVKLETLAEGLAALACYTKSSDLVKKRRIPSKPKN